MWWASDQLQAWIPSMMVFVWKGNIAHPPELAEQVAFRSRWTGLLQSRNEVSGELPASRLYASNTICHSVTFSHKVFAMWSPCGDVVQGFPFVSGWVTRVTKEGACHGDKADVGDRLGRTDGQNQGVETSESLSSVGDGSQGQEKQWGKERQASKIQLNTGQAMGTKPRENSPHHWSERKWAPENWIGGHGSKGERTRDNTTQGI